MNTELMKLIKDRRSIRKFKKIEIPEEQILKIVDAGNWAPTGCNSQEIRFLILRKREDISAVFRIRDLPFILESSLVVMLFADVASTIYAGYAEGYSRTVFEHLKYIDCGMAMQNMILYAKTIGLASCCVNLWVSDAYNKFAENYNVPVTYFPLCVVVFGEANESIDLDKDRHNVRCVRKEPVESVCSFDKF